MPGRSATPKDKLSLPSMATVLSSIESQSGRLPDEKAQRSMLRELIIGMAPQSVAPDSAYTNRLVDKVLDKLYFVVRQPINAKRIAEFGSSRSRTGLLQMLFDNGPSILEVTVLGKHGLVDMSTRKHRGEHDSKIGETRRGTGGTLESINVQRRASVKSEREGVDSEADHSTEDGQVTGSSHAPKTRTISHMTADDQASMEEQAKVSEQASAHPERPSEAQSDHPSSQDYTVSPKAKGSVLSAGIQGSRSLKRSVDQVELENSCRDEISVSKKAKLPAENSNRGRPTLGLAKDSDHNDSAPMMADSDEENLEQVAVPTMREMPQPGPRRSSDIQTGPNAQTRQWMVQAGLRKTPVHPPTKKPANPSEIVIIPDRRWIKDHMDHLHSHLYNAASFYCQENNLSTDSSFKFETFGDARLEHLYATLFGIDDWRRYLFNLKDLGFLKYLKQDSVLAALLGAHVYNTVFQKDLPWDLAREVRDNLGSGLHILSAVIDDLGHDVDNVLRHMVGKQIGSQEFRDTRVEEHATRLSGELILILQPLLSALQKTKSRTKVSPDIVNVWYGELRKAFREAIVIKQTLLGSPGGPYVYDWVCVSTKFERSDHMARYIPDQGDAAHVGNSQVVLMSALPGIRKSEPEGWVRFHEALVIPVSRPAGKDAVLRKIFLASKEKR